MRQSAGWFFCALLGGFSAAAQGRFEPRSGTLRVSPPAQVLATNAQGRPLSIRDGSGTATIQYDAQGRVSMIKAAGGATRLVEYATRGNTNSVCVWTTDGSRTAYRFAPGWEDTESSDPDGHLASRMFTDLRTGIQMHYDREGAEHIAFPVAGRGGAREVVSRRAGQLPVRAQFDAAGQAVEWQAGPLLARHIVGDPQSPEARQQVGARGLVRSADGRSEALVQGGQVVLLRAFDAQGRLAAMQRPDGARTTFAYDQHGRLTQTTGWDGGVTRLAYDDNETRLTLPDGSERVLRETAEGLRWSEGRGQERRALLARTDALNETTTWTLEGFETQQWYTPRRERVAIFRSAVFGNWSFLKDENASTVTRADPLGEVVLFRHDAQGRLLSKTDAAGGLLAGFRYDEDGRWLEARGQASRLTREYDQFSRPVRLNDWPAGLALTLGYDASGGLSSVSDSDGEQVRFLRDATGLLLEAQSKGAGLFRLLYGANRWPEALERPNGVVTRWRYDAAGRIREIQHSGPTGTLARVAYEYDAAGRVTVVEESAQRRHRLAYDAFGQQRAAAFKGAPHPTAAFDAWGNPVALYGKACAYERPGCPNAWGEMRIRCDAAGRMLETFEGTNRNAFAYDADHRLVQLVARDGTRVAWSYDAFGRVATHAVGGHNQRLTHLGNRLYATSDSSGQRLRKYIRIPDLGLCVAVIRADGTVHYPLTDAAGTITHLTDRSGTVTAQRQFNPLGGLLSERDELQLDLGFRSALTFRNLLLLWNGRMLHTWLQRALALPAVEPTASGLHASNPVSFLNGDPLSATGWFVPDGLRP